MPADGAADTNARPAGSRLTMRTPVASFGPALTAETVNVTISPVGTTVRSAVLRTCTSATGSGVITALAASLPPSGSTWSDTRRTAMFTIGAGPVTWALIVSVALAPLASAPGIHTPETGSYVP